MQHALQKIIALIIPLALVLAWAGGEIRKKEATIARINNISADIEAVTKIDETLYQGHVRGKPDEKVYIALAEKPSYGGPLSVAAVVNEEKTIRHVAVMDSSDTSTYLEKIVGLGILKAFVNRSLERMPQVDAITGATMSSTAITRGLESAANHIGSAKFNMPQKEAEQPPVTPEKTKLIVIALLFAGAFYVSGKSFRWNRKQARYVLMGLSVITLGFLYGAQFSLSTLVVLLGGDWIHGMASYAAMFCLLLALVVYVATRKNLYCSTVCPFGAIQEGLGCITGCSTPPRSRWMIRTARTFTLAVLLAALYYRAPSDAIYEPFGKAFNFIGSGVIYGLTILVVITSLMFKRPWCLLLCPATSMFDYLKLARSAFRNKASGKGGLQQKNSQWNMKKIFSIALFVGFILLSAAEILPKFRLSAERDIDSVRFTASASQKKEAPVRKNGPIDYKEMLDATSSIY